MAAGVRNALIGLVVGAAFYLLLIDTTSLPELAVLGAGALLAAVAFASARAQAGGEGSIEVRSWSHVWRVLAGTPRQIAVVAVASLLPSRQRGGARAGLRVVRFRGGDAPPDLGRYALIESLGSFAPNTIIIGVDHERGLLLVHQLRRDGGRENLDILGLG